MKKEQYDIHASLGLNHWWHYGTKIFFRKLINRTLPKGSDILDTGCGVGDMLMLLKEDHRVVGIDRSEDAINYCLEKGLAGNVIFGDVNNLPFNNESFDGVLSLDVLYHRWVPDDLQALKEIYRILRPKGKVFVQLPAYEWLKSSHDEWAFSSRRYTAGRLTDLLRSAGFVKKRVSYRVFLLFPLAVVSRIVFRSKDSDMKKANPLVNSIFKMIISFENSLALYLNSPFGLSVIGVAEK